MSTATRAWLLGAAAGGLAVVSINNNLIKRNQDAILLSLRRALASTDTLAINQLNNDMVSRKLRFREFLNLAIVEISDRYIFPNTIA